MKISILYAGRAAPFVGWLVIDELAELLAHYFQAELLSPQPLPTRLISRVLRRSRTRYAPLDSNGGDVLIVVANAPGSLSMINAIPHCRKKFKKIYGVICDSYFQKGFVSETEQFDAITVTAHEDIEYPASRFHIPVFQLDHGVDGLTWAPRTEMVRTVDLIAYGRTPPSYHAQFMQRFHAARSPYLYLHSPLGNLSGPDVRLERGMLFKLLHRSSVSLAFNLLVEPTNSRPRSMMVTSRWLESLLAGCIVAGIRPVSRMADEMLFWPDATVEISEDPVLATDQLEELLSRKDLDAQRQTNIAHILEHHDWRYRILSLCQLFDLPVPESLQEDISQLKTLRQTFA